MRLRTALPILLLACSEETPPAGDAADPGVPGPDAAPALLPAGSACSTAEECLGGTCLGALGQPQEGNPRFTGGYCTSLGCTPESQDGCGPEEWCTTAGELAFCVAICSASAGISCQRDDHVCLGIGEFGGCFHEDRVQCDSTAHTGCREDQVCVRIGFDDDALGACEDSCDPMAAHGACGPGQGCYYINRYDGALCLPPGESLPGEACLCDRCCVPGFACVQELCRPTCSTNQGCASGGTCVPSEPEAPYGGCVP